MGIRMYSDGYIILVIDICRVMDLYPQTNKMSMLWVRMYSDGYIILVIDICRVMDLYPQTNKQDVHVMGTHV